MTSGTTNVRLPYTILPPTQTEGYDFAAVGVLGIVVDHGIPGEVWLEMRRFGRGGGWVRTGTQWRSSEQTMVTFLEGMEYRVCADAPGSEVLLAKAER